MSCGLRHLLVNPSSPLYAWCRINAMSDAKCTQSGYFRPAMVVCGRGAEPIRLASTVGYGTQELTEAKLLECLSAVEANLLAKQHGWPDISAHAFALKRQIFAVQSLTQADPRIWEVHPEVSFAGSIGRMPRAWAKSSWNGAALRPRILESLGITIPRDLGPAGAVDVPVVLDASIAAWPAHRIAEGAAGSFPAGADCIGAIWRYVPPKAPIGLSSI